MTIITYLALVIHALIPVNGTNFMQRLSLHNQPIFLMDNKNMENHSRKKRIDLLKLKTLDCTNKAHCADLHYHIAELYLSYESPDRETLKRAEYHLNKVKEHSQHTEQAMLLYNLLSGWISEIKQTKILKKRLENTKAVDLKKIKPLAKSK